LKQHNGKLKGGAKASRAGRPWICACIIRGFNDRSEGNFLLCTTFTNANESYFHTPVLDFSS